MKKNTLLEGLTAGNIVLKNASSVALYITVTDDGISITASPVDPATAELNLGAVDLKDKTMPSNATAAAHLAMVAAEGISAFLDKTGACGEATAVSLEQDADGKLVDPALDKMLKQIKGVLH